MRSPADLLAAWSARPRSYSRAVWALVLALDALPWPWGEEIVARAFVRLTRFRRARAWAGAQPGAAGQRWRLACALCAHHGRFVARSALMGMRDPAALRRLIAVRGEEHLAALGAGAILLGFHLGPAQSYLALRASGHRLTWVGGRGASPAWAAAIRELLSARRRRSPLSGRLARLGAPPVPGPPAPARPRPRGLSPRHRRAARHTREAIPRAVLLARVRLAGRRAAAARLNGPRLAALGRAGPPPRPRAPPLRGRALRGPGRRPGARRGRHVPRARSRVRARDARRRRPAPVAPRGPRQRADHRRAHHGEERRAPPAGTAPRGDQVHRVARAAGAAAWGYRTGAERGGRARMARCFLEDGARRAARCLGIWPALSRALGRLPPGT